MGIDIENMLDELRAQRAAIEEAIVTLDRLSLGYGERRGRPPAWLAEGRVRDMGAAQPKPSQSANANKPQGE